MIQRLNILNLDRFEITAIIPRQILANRKTCLHVHDYFLDNIFFLCCMLPRDVNTGNIHV